MSTTTLNYSYTTQSAAPPGDKQVRINAGATAVYIDDQASDGTDVSATLLALAVGDQLEIRGVTDTTRYAQFSVAGAPLDRGGYVEVPVQSAASGAALSNGTCTLTLTTQDQAADPRAGMTGVVQPDSSMVLTAVASQEYVDEQVSDALARWAVLNERLGYVQAIAAPWEASNPSLVMTPDGVAFGPYADGKAAGGSLRYHGFDGQPFSVVHNFAYSMRYLDDEMVLLDPGASPYARIFMQDAQAVVHDAAFTPGSQQYHGLGPGPVQEFVATAGMWRYDDDAGTGGVPLSDLQAQYGDQLITKITVTLGFTDGTNLSGLLRYIQLNGNRYTFGSA